MVGVDAGTRSPRSQELFEDALRLRKAMDEATGEGVYNRSSDVFQDRRDAEEDLQEANQQAMLAERTPFQARRETEEESRRVALQERAAHEKRAMKSSLMKMPSSPSPPPPPPTTTGMHSDSSSRCKVSTAISIAILIPGTLVCLSCRKLTNPRIPQRPCCI
jgi:hypothetical protein